MKILVYLLICFGLSLMLTGCFGGEDAPEATKAANTTLKTYSWIEGSWGSCSVTACGTSGTQSKSVACRDSANTNVADSLCISNVGPKPATSQGCAAQGCQNTSCTLPASLGGGTLSHNASITAYQAQQVSSGQSCVSQVRTCNNANLSGSYLYSNCTVSNPPSNASGIDIDLSYVNMASTKYTRFKNYVDAKLNGGNPYGFSGVDAAFMFRLTNQVSYCNLAVTLAEQQVAAAESTINGGGRPAVSGDSYLEVGLLISEVAIAYDWCRAQTTSAQRARWENYANQTIYNVWNYNQATWGGRPYPWSGWSVTNPGNNYFYSFTKATIYWGLASGNASTINLARSKLNMINNYYSGMPGGGSLEGTGYGTAHMNLFELYQIWKDSVNEDYANMNPHLTDSVRYWLHATIPSRAKLAAIGDQARSSEPTIFDYHRILGLYAAHLTNSASAREIGSWWLNHISVQTMSQAFTSRHDLLTPAVNNATAPTEPLVYRATGAGQLFARTGWDTNALWMQFGAGTYNESHAHQDQGAFSLASTDYLAITSNIWSHSGINQSTEIHNLVKFVNGGTTIPQREGTTSTITINSQNTATGAVNATANLTAAYANNANITAWTRNIDFANRTLTVRDNFTVSTGTQGIFQVIVPTQPTVTGNVITAGNLTITVQTPTNPTISIMNWTTSPLDTFSRGYRIEVRGPAGSGSFQVQLRSP
ncbi:MAG: thrombospondin type-1 domain-containing protein [Bdellovibrionota bacterium]